MRSAVILKPIAKALAIWFSLAALTLQAMAPLCLAGLMAGPSAGTGAFLIPICTGHGFQTVKVDGSGKPLPNSPVQDDQNSTCPLCSAMAQVAHFPTPVPILILVPLALGRAPIAKLPAPFRIAHVAASYISRAPPFAVLPYPL